jgi:hypothetical protein
MRAEQSCSVQRTDNAPRVRDGYTSSGTSGHARTLETRLEGSICRTMMIARARACPPVPPGNLHGKEVSTVRVRQRALKRPANGLFVASTAYAHRSIVPLPVPRICPQHPASALLMSGGGVVAAAAAGCARTARDDRASMARAASGPSALLMVFSPRAVIALTPALCRACWSLLHPWIVSRVGV